ncbi:glycosyl hydrolase family 7 [Colletotrichum truncatum]|uniref:Glycosyl hydrolase family 7 n=1 Tax=Colletotrichum truncatum TaxID=5467 RepID=A0ACC3YRJ8_COLTU|nr:glycosyl hydrolase family 7 [Colletotrichum truncatum]KAF6799201.1 glycosyl hydrolase family 7 [Colletotrichum truncatum]
MALSILSASLLLASIVAGQTPGNTTDNHPKLETFRCTLKDGCVKKTNYIVVDSSQHPINTKDGTSCLTGNNPPNPEACPNAEACAKNCIIEGIADYTTKGVITSGADLRMKILNNGTEVSPRVYLLEENKQRYEMLHLTGAEFTFDVDMVKLPCGMNSALYLSEMLPDGGKNTSMLNKAGVAYGTGYCDAQCFKTSFINGVANIDNKGSCCNELDIWEANSRATHIAPHPCSKPGLYQCTGEECEKQGVCDKSGCSTNPNRLNVTNFYGRGNNFKVDTTRKFTVVTQFPAEGGKLKELRRLYVQDGKVVDNNVVNIAGSSKLNFLNDDICKANNAQEFMNLGGMTGMGESMTRGMVLALSIWWDKSTAMEWLDTKAAGPCNATEGFPENIVKVEANPEVTFSNIRYGEINSTMNMKL